MPYLRPSRHPARPAPHTFAAALLALATLVFPGRALAAASDSTRTAGPGVPRAEAAAPSAPRADAAAHLVILSTTDVKGKTSPCGCHTPKGGFARRASFADSVRASNPLTLIVDSGGFLPDTPDYQPDASFMFDAMKAVGVDAAGLGERDLTYGRAFLLAQIARTNLPVVCANLLDKASRRPLVKPWLVRSVGRTKVGVFGLISDRVDLGVARDSLFATDPSQAAASTIAALRKQGATVIVLLSELGKVETEDVAVAVDGIDAAIAGRNVLMLQRGRMLKHTVMCYGGEQSQFMGVTTLDLDARGRVIDGRNEVAMLGPTVGEKPALLAMVKNFEDDFNVLLRKLEKERAADAAKLVDSTGGVAVDHFLGADVCARCHKPEYDQWKTTDHARAWQTLVDKKVDARPDCQPCHVLGFRSAGGFHNGDDATRLGNVQCESCHGMGTGHESSPAAAVVVTEATCRKCHDETSSPVFSFAIYQPHILHQVPAHLPPLPPRPSTMGATR